MERVQDQEVQSGTYPREDDITRYSRMITEELRIRDA